MTKRLTGVLRRTVFKRFAAGAAVAAIARPAFAVPETIKIGLVAPQTGPLALFNEEMAYALDHARKALNNSIKINGTVHPLEFVVKDSQSNPNRAAEVAQELILKDKVHLVTAFATPETVNPVADQCELNGMPCVTNDDPLESYFFGRHGDPKKGFDWTYNFFFSGERSARRHDGGLVQSAVQQDPGRAVGERRRRPGLRQGDAARPRQERFQGGRSRPLRPAGKQFLARNRRLQGRRMSRSSWP